MKEIKDMLEKMREIIAEQLNCDGETIGLDTSFKDDLGADSLDLFELLWLWKKNTDWRFRQRNCQMWKPSET